jgi:ribosomal 30S subunit maturation factor RimM
MKYRFLTMLLASTTLMTVAASAQQAQPQQGQPQTQQQQAQQPGQMQAGQLHEMPVGELMNREVVSEEGEPIGTVASVVSNEGQEQFIVVEMMQDQSQILLPVERVEMRGDQIVAHGARGGQIAGSQPFGEEQRAQFQQVDEQQPVRMGGQQAQTEQQAGQQPAQQQPTGAQIRVQQQPAQVEVRQQAPQIIVRQAPPTIIVQQPQPEIIVRMPEPQVAVQQAQPQVRIEEAQPQVQTEAAQAQVRTQQAQPQVTFERTGEPQIQFQEAQGQPQVRIERMGDGQQPPAGQQGQQTQQGQQQAQVVQPQTQSGQQVQPNQQQTGQQQIQQRDARTMFGVGQEQQARDAAATMEQQQVPVAELEGADVYNYDGEELGTVDRILQDPQSDQFFVVVTHGGFLGLGQSEVVMPLERMVMTGDRLLIQGVTEADLEAMDDAEVYAGYPRAEGNVGLGRRN